MSSQQLWRSRFASSFCMSRMLRQEVTQSTAVLRSDRPLIAASFDCISTALSILTRFCSSHLAAATSATATRDQPNWREPPHQLLHSHTISQEWERSEADCRWPTAGERKRQHGGQQRTASLLCVCHLTFALLTACPRDLRTIDLLSPVFSSSQSVAAAVLTAHSDSSSASR